MISVLVLMQASQKRPTNMYDQPVQGFDSYCLPHIQVLDNNNTSSDAGSSRGTAVAFQAYKDQFFTLESSSVSSGFAVYDSPTTVSVSSHRSPFSPQQYSSENAYGSPMSGSSIIDDGTNELRHRLRELEYSLLGPESDIIDSCGCCYNNSGAHQNTPSANWNWDQIKEMIPRLDLKQVLIFCAQAVSEGDTSTASGLMSVLEQMVSVSGEPIQRLAAYMLEGLRARVEFSGSKIYKALRCEVPTSPDLLTYMRILYQICPYWKFAYTSANVVIEEAVENEPVIHIIDFQIAQGTQWMALIQDLAKRPGGPPLIRITGIDDSQSTHARGGGLHIVGQHLTKVAAKYNVQLEFHDAKMTACEVHYEHLRVQPGEAVVVNFPFVLHHMPDESVCTSNHRDRLLRLVKSLSPKVVTLVEQESNTNTSPFFHRFLETLDYYTAMFESIDVARPRDDKQRISAEQHCVARDIVNMIACEAEERIERHELLEKWRLRFNFAGFTVYPLSPSVTNAVTNMLKDYNGNFRVEEQRGALYLGWMNRAMATSSAWR